MIHPTFPLSNTPFPDVKSLENRHFWPLSQCVVHPEQCQKFKLMKGIYRK